MPTAPLSRRLLAFVLAVLGTYAVACISATQGALAALPEIAQPISMGVRLQTTIADLGGMALRFAPLITLALVAGFAVAAAVIRWLPNLRTLGYVLGGATALVAMHLIMKSTFDNIAPVAATRTVVGLAAQGVAGAFGGWLFARISAPTAG
ncbi:MAG: hypothetical protein AAGI15_11915 [Pseudomonadota bacterium]